MGGAIQSVSAGAPAIATERLLLRGIRPHDHDAYYAGIFSDPAVMRTLGSGRTLSREEFDARLAGLTSDHWTAHGFGLWVVMVRATGEVIGHCGLRRWPDSTDVEVLYALGTTHWGQGFATESARASLRFAFEDRSLERVIGVVFVGNDAFAPGSGEDRDALREHVRVSRTPGAALHDWPRRVRSGHR